MKILLANMTAYPTIGGVENSLRYIGRELLSLGHEVKVFCLRSTPEEPPRVEHEGVEIIRAPYRPAKWPHQRLRRAVDATSTAIPELLREFPADAVWCRSMVVGTGIRRGGFKGPLLQIFSTNARMHSHGIYLATRGLPWKRRLMLLGLWPSEYFTAARFERELARRCTAVAFSDNMRTQLLADFPPEARTCHVIPPGVDSEIFSPEAGARHFEILEKEYGVRAGDPIVLYVGRLSTAKHIPMLMDAMALLETPARLVLVGGGRDESRLRAYGERLGLGERILFAGSHHELLPAFYAASRVCVLPTTTESFGQTYLESLACGTPAVGFGRAASWVRTATDEVIKDGETGVVVQQIDKGALAAGIDRVLKLDDDAYVAMSRAARDDMQARFSWPQFVASAVQHSRDGGNDIGEATP